MTVPDTAIGLGKLAAGVGHLGLREQPVRRPDVGEVLVEVLAAGICGTDLHIADDEFPSTPPVTMGHEVTGVVVEVGPGVDRSWSDARVAVETYFAYCERCAHCRGGRPNLCAERRSIGSHVDGGFCRWLTVPARNLHVLPATVGLHAGALAEPLACVANCLFDPPVVQAGDRVVVTGPGTMGVIAAQVARAAGGDVTLIGLESDRVRLDIAASLGLATSTPDLFEGTCDVGIECSGAEAGADWLMRLGRKGGSYVQVGIFGKPVTLDIDLLLYHELAFRSGFASTPTSWQRAMRLLESGAVALDPLVSEVIPLGEWERAIASTRAGEGMKFVLDPRHEVQP